ncbi:MAG: GAK system XXXCH domain-containing protein [Desulfurivibrionaceae bacterium]
MAGSDRKITGMADQKYRPLKKLIKKNFKSISVVTASGRLPGAPLMEDFMAQAKVMVSYPGFGDDRYSIFMAACEGLYEAFLQKDSALFAARLAVLSSTKKECHHRYK